MDSKTEEMALKASLLDAVIESRGRQFLMTKPDLIGKERLEFEKGTAKEHIFGLCYVLGKNISVTTSLNLVGQELDDTDVLLIGLALKTNTTLTSLSLSGNKFGDEGLKTIGEALKMNTTLRSLSIDHTDKIGDIGARYVAKGLKANTTLTSLDMWRSCIGNAGAQAFAEALKDNQTMKYFTIWGGMGDAGVCELCKALETTQVSDLSVHATSTTSVGAKSVCSLIQKTRSLGYIGIQCIKFKDEALKLLCETLKANTTLKIIDLASNGFDETEKSLIREAVKDKKGFQLAFAWDPKAGWMRETM